MNSDVNDEYPQFKAYAAEELGVQDDNFEHLFTPHRMAYVNNETPRGRKGEHDCPFCTAPDKTDAEGLIVYRGKLAYCLMNLFPYNSAHVLVCPYRHISNYIKATEDEVLEIGVISQQAISALQKSFNPAGFNLGINNGDVAGAGIKAHLHQHIVPRWLGDANFLTITAGTRAVPTLLEDARSQLSDAWGK
ncbi:MAG: HIT domain-containing protein [Candidatus Ancillula sp.]|jgi:ATP adenylyltransferase|nr:HIT domain-containing protein [Candidatus Ancillula sp.]